MSYLRDTHQSVQAASGNSSWWDNVTIARNLVEATAPALIYPDDGDEKTWEDNPKEAANPLIKHPCELRTEIERLCLVSNIGKASIKKAPEKVKADRVRPTNPSGYVS
jgi:hypothetical protein